MGHRLLDQYSLLHFAVGIIMYFFNVSFFWWNIIHIIFEITENSQLGMSLINQYITIWPGGKNYADDTINSVGDVLSGAVGWGCAYLLDWYGTKYGWFNRHIKDS